jgi:hypothetical protein
MGHILNGTHAVEAWRAHNMSKGYTEVPSPGIEPATVVCGVPRRNQVPRLKFGTRWGYMRYIYPVRPERHAPALHPLLAR